MHIPFRAMLLRFVDRVGENDKKADIIEGKPIEIISNIVTVKSEKEEPFK